MKKLHLEVIDKKRQGILKKLSLLFQKQYYLAGGTALALQIGHRESMDFDLFANKELSFVQKKILVKAFSKNKLQTLADTADELTVIIDGSIKITLLNYYWGPLLPLIHFTGIMPLLSIKEIAATKAYTIGRRGNYRDYFDLYVVIRNKFASLKEIIKLCTKKYGDLFSARMLLEQLTYLDDAPKDEKLRYLNEKYIAPGKLISFFKKEIICGN
ncbi:MAG: nucleotidyl transferase AbiEii/AbiGii toxin family protein [Candidatus Margulisbacteria bacterium]|nr:nucleotidyl transferase AbiEii/AbiGii toxin family protein [Candidatus Margulisiibacteriota bacterium]